MTRADAGAPSNEQRCSCISLRSSSTIGRIASAPRSMIARPPILTTCTQGRAGWDDRPRRAGQIGIEEGLARERRGDVLGVVGSVMGSASLRGDDACPRARRRARGSGCRRRGRSTCTSWMWRDALRKSSIGNSRIDGQPLAFISSTVIFGMNLAFFDVFGFAVLRPFSSLTKSSPSSRIAPRQGSIRRRFGRAGSPLGAGRVHRP